VEARRKGREVALQARLNDGDAALVAAAISELARNVLLYAGEGDIVICTVENGIRHGVVVTAADRGPGISDLDLAMQDGYSTSGGLGLGLPGVKRLMDEFDVTSEKGEGTTVIAKKWAS
jgi:serine/threonine-protein kinase RsbT